MTEEGGGGIAGISDLAGEMGKVGRTPGRGREVCKRMEDKITVTVSGKLQGTILLTTPQAFIISWQRDKLVSIYSSTWGHPGLGSLPVMAVPRGLACLVFSMHAFGGRLLTVALHWHGEDHSGVSAPQGFGSHGLPPRELSLPPKGHALPPRETFYPPTEPSFLQAGLFPLPTRPFPLPIEPCLPEEDSGLFPVKHCPLSRRLCPLSRRLCIFSRKPFLLPGKIFPFPRRFFLLSRRSSLLPRMVFLPPGNPGSGSGKPGSCLGNPISLPGSLLFSHGKFSPPLEKPFPLAPCVLVSSDEYWVGTAPGTGGKPAPSICSP